MKYIASFLFFTIYLISPLLGQDVDAWDYSFEGDSIKEGFTKLYNEEGQLIGEGIVRNSKKNGIWTFYYETGALARITEY